MRVLVVEDTEDSRILLEDILKVAGYSVDSAVNGVEALNKARRMPPDMIISDILMPEMDGFELCRQIKQDQELKTVPFIFYTATYTDARDEELALSLGATRFLIKPQKPTKLLELLEAIWEEHASGNHAPGISVSDDRLGHMHADVLNHKLNTKLLELQRLENELKLAALVYENTSEGMLVTDESNKIIAVNPAFTAITGYEFEDVKGQNPNILQSGHHDRAFFKSMWDTLLTEDKWQGEIWDKRKSGEVYPKWLSINVIRNDKAGIERYVAIFSDITDKKQSEELIWRQANFDALTGLPNRDMFRQQLEHALQQVGTNAQRLALLLIDLDLFKEINDTLGHDVGDKLLKEATQRITRCTGKTDTVARLGGDEFAVILPTVKDNDEVDAIANQITACLAEPYHIGNDVVYVSGSVGIALYPDDAENIDILLQNAEQAMYAAKRKGRNGFSYFTQSLQDAAQSRLRLTNDLRQALHLQQFRIYFQPIVDLTNDSIYKAEALLRWQHPQRGLLEPMTFIPLAEETGLINAIGDWVFKEAVNWTDYWKKQFGYDYQVSVNMSPIQFRVEERVFVVDWLQYLQNLGLSGKNVTVEITEGLLLNAEAGVTNKLLALRDAGIQVAIDDFGTGYSSLSYLKKFDIDYLKIDQSFVRNLETDANDIALCEAIIVMAHKLGLKVIAEGVESQGQQKILVDAGCDYAQGYLYSHALPAKEYEVFLEKMRRPA